MAVSGDDNYTINDGTLPTNCEGERDVPSSSVSLADDENPVYYSTEGTLRYAQLKTSVNWRYDGLKTTAFSLIDTLQQSSSLKPADIKVIDVGCGEGNCARALSDQFGFGQIVGVDKSEYQLELARKRTPHSSYPNITYQRVDVGSDTAETVQSLGGPFDIVLAMWLYNYAESKTELLEYLRWTHSLLKRGGTVIAVNNTIEHLQDAENGPVKNDSKFQTEFVFEKGVREGAIIVRLGDGGEGAVQLPNYLYTHNTYHTLLEVSGFGDIRFLKGDDYIGGSHSSPEEKERFREFMTWKGTCNGMFVATKV